MGPTAIVQTGTILSIGQLRQSRDLPAARRRSTPRISLSSVVCRYLESFPNPRTNRHSPALVTRRRPIRRDVGRRAHGPAIAESIGNNRIKEQATSHPATRVTFAGSSQGDRVILRCGKAPSQERTGVGNRHPDQLHVCFDGCLFALTDVCPGAM